jgi:hypothetical protein
MSLALAPETADALAEGRVVDRGMILFDLGSGLYGFWTGRGPFAHAGVTYVGAGSLIEIDGMRQVADLSAVPLVVRLTAIENTALTPDLLARIEDEHYHQRPCTISTAYFHPDSYALLSVEPEYRGYIDRIVHTESEDGQALLEAHLESRFRDHLRTGYRVRSDADQRRINPTDDGLRHVMTVANEPVLFGRTAEPPPRPRRKRFLGIF